MVQLTFGARMRLSPFHAQAMRAGLSHASVYNHMVLPVAYGDALAEYWRLINDCALWDVGVERQVEIVGPDAFALVQRLCSRDLTKLAVGKGKYVALCDHDGTLINDPVLLKLADDRFWLSIADSDILFWARAVAGERGYDVQVFEPDVSPLAVQGPKAEDVVASLFGEDIRALKSFWFTETHLDGIPLVLARSGWSKQGGFELYLTDGSHGDALWQNMMEAGRPFNIGPGAPNAIERIESGLLSYGSDTDDATNPFEVRLDRFVSLDTPADYIGKAALQRIAENGPARLQVGLVLDTAPAAATDRKWPISQDGETVGYASSIVHSPRLERSIGIGLVRTDLTEPGTRVVIDSPDGPIPASVADLPFL